MGFRGLGKCRGEVAIRIRLLFKGSLKGSINRC